MTPQYGLKEIKMARHEFTVLEAPPEMKPLTRIVCRETERSDVRAAFLDPKDASLYSDHLNGIGSGQLMESKRLEEAKASEDKRLEEAKALAEKMKTTAKP